MSSWGAFKKRCVIQKLDFENSIVSNVKTKSRNRRKFRARITHEIKNCEEQGRGECPQGSPVLKIKKPRGNKSQGNKRKLDFSEFSGSSVDEIPSSQTSPVFRLKTSRISIQERDKTLSQDGLSTGGSNYQIEDFSEDSKQTPSLDGGNAETKTPENYFETGSVAHTFVTSPDTGSPNDDWLELLEKLNGTSAPIRKRYKKNSLRGRLETLLKKKASDKLIWQHERRNKVAAKFKLSVVSLWSEESKFFFLKCRTLGPAPEMNFLVIDSAWAPNVRTAKVGSVIHLHPPWQKLSVDKPPLTVFVNVVCLEVMDDVMETTPEDVKLESTPPEVFDFNPLKFIESLLASNISSYLY